MVVISRERCWANKRVAFLHDVGNVKLVRLRSFIIFFVSHNRKFAVVWEFDGNKPLYPFTFSNSSMPITFKFFKEGHIKTSCGIPINVFNEVYGNEVVKFLRVYIDIQGVSE